MEDWSFTFHSDCGPRDENQDNFLLIGPTCNCFSLKDEEYRQGNIKTWPADHIRLAVADGMGGHAQGREFAERVIDSLIRLEFQTTPEQLKKSAEALHCELFAEFFNGKKSPGSTLVLADITPDGNGTLLNIGDSRAYISSSDGILFEDSEMVTLTHDHTEVEFAWRVGLIDDEQLASLQNGATSPIAQAIGFGHLELAASDNPNIPFTKQHKPSLTLNLESEHKDVFSFTIEKGQCLTLASDGWWNPDSQDNSTMLQLTRKQ